MKAVIQRVSRASVQVDKNTIGQINHGLLIYLGIGIDDELEDVSWLANKITQLRIFDDEEHIPNRNINDVNGDILLISQFTLHAKTKKGNRPSYIKAARPEKAIPLYTAMTAALADNVKGEIATGKFGANMQIDAINDGPLTILIDTKNKV